MNRNEYGTAGMSDWSDKKIEIESDIKVDTDFKKVDLANRKEEI